MRGHAKALALLLVASVVPTIILWLPFFARLSSFWGIPLPQEGMASIIANFDGPYYLVAAKSLYNPEFISETFSFPLPAIYYAAHYPLFPILIRLVATVVPGVGYPWAMMLVTVVTSVLALWMFYLLLFGLGLKRKALPLALVFSVFPARWLIVRSIGSPEPLFIFTILASVYFFRKKRFWPSGIFGALAVATKPPGILLFIAYLLVLLVRRFPKLATQPVSRWLRALPWETYPIFLIPATLLGVFTWYARSYGSFFAYFNSGDNIHLMFPPFQVFNPSLTWVGTFWLEEIIFIYLLGFLGLVFLIKQKRRILAWLVGIFFLTILFVSHRDIARYSLPIVPFLLIAFSDILTRKEFFWALALLAIPIYLFSLAFITGNVTPVPDWGPLL